MNALPWHLQPMTAFDLETTGVDTREARIVTAYVATFGARATDGRGRARFERTSLIVDPGIPIPPEASRVHGITDEIARAKGVHARDGVNTVAQEVAASLLARIPIVGFNLAYDLTLLYRECLRWELPTVAERLGRPPASMVGPIIDASVLDKHFDQYRKGSRKLTDVTAHYGITLDNAHTADADAIAALRVAVAVATKFAGVDMPTDVVALHHMQKAWRADQAAGLQRHFRTKGGRPDAYVDPCWPLCTDDTHPSG